MTAQRSSSRPRTDPLELKPEVGLAEWTSKIKDMQRQVDADEVAEQIRLEAEIAASRLARHRRSQGLGYGSRTESFDLSTVKDGTANHYTGEPDATSIDTPRTSVEKQSTRADTLQRLTGASSTTASVKDPKADKPFTYTRPPSDKSQAISLAAFMGGRGTGPRLNKHTPQQDAHDPTQFQQRVYDNAPHPTFGTGGVAMPGIAVQRDGLMKPSALAALSKTKSSGRVSDLPAAVKKYSETYERQTPSPSGTGIRERTISTPSYASSGSWAATKQPKHTSPTSSHTPYLSRTPIPAERAVQQRDTRPRSISPAPPLSKSVDRPVTPRQPIDDMMASPFKSPIMVPSLAGPIRPQPRPSASGPQIPPSVTPSKAFLRPPSHKEPTPSLSRLQGRGFVQSMVQVSSQLESPPPSIPETPEQNKPESGRRSSVLDRWQLNVSPSMPSPPVTPTPHSMRRSVTTDSTVMEKSQVSPADPVKKPWEGPISSPSTKRENIPPHPNPSSKSNGSERPTPTGLGSATTLVVYKTKPIDVPALDEFGFKPYGSSRGAKDAVLDLPAPSKPLSHPTKERARKPRKQKASPSDTQAISPASMVHGSPPDLLAEVASNDSAVTLAPPESNVEALQGRSTTSARAPPPALAPLADEPRLSRQPIDQMRRAMPSFVASRQTNAIVPAARLIGELEQTSNLSIRQPLPGLTSPRISGKPPLSKLAAQDTPSVEQTNHGVARRALPGMVPSAPSNDKDSEIKSITQTVQQTPLLDKKGELPPPLSSSKHTRIPSTGNRATVMDVAQALSELEGANAEEPPELSDSPQPMASNRPRSLAPAHAEKRKSSYEKYSSIILPPLKEEATPTPTPSGTLSRREGNGQQKVLEDSRQVLVEQPSVGGSILGKAVTRLPPSTDTRPSDIVKQVPLGFNIDSIIKHTARPTLLEPGTTTISVEVMAISGTTATTLAKDRTIFYDTEILAIIHRSKSQISGLVSTAIWGWEGKRAKLGEREQRKLQELAKRYGTSVNIVHQDSEPPQLVHVLGGVLAIRQGTRTHWTPENTAMHLVRSVGGMILVDEKDLLVRNLCSAYSYCVSILGSVYVWYGRGSVPLERKAALEYGRSLTSTAPPIELTENGGDDDEMFWMILGDEEYANADYWRWRRSSPIADPRIWRVKADLGVDGVTIVDFISNETSFHDSVYIIDCIWEFYVMVGSSARAHRQDIELALHVASDLSSRVSVARPYPPTIHTLIFPSQLPRDLRLALRDLDEFSVNKGDIPDHMNILSSTEAYDHLKKPVWDKSALQDPTMLPLGIDTTQLP